MNSVRSNSQSLKYQRCMHYLVAKMYWFKNLNLWQRLNSLTLIDITCPPYQTPSALGVFHQPEAYFAACTAEGLDYVIPFNIFVFLLHLLVFMISNLIVRCYASQEEGCLFSWIQYVQCSISKTVTIGAIASTGFICLILVIMTMPSMESNGGISLYFGFGAPLAGVLMHVLKEYEFTYPCLMALLSEIKGFFCCKQNQVHPIQDSQNPQLPFVINVQPINPLEDDSGIFVG